MTPLFFFRFLGARRADGSGDTPVLFLFLGARRAELCGQLQRKAEALRWPA